VHLESRISPAELQQRAKIAKGMDKLQAAMRRWRWQRLRTHPEVQAGVKRFLQRLRDRIRERHEQQEAARAAEAAALQAAAAAAAPPASAPGGAVGRGFVDQRPQMRAPYLTPVMLENLATFWLGCSAQDPTRQGEVQQLQNLWLSTDALYYGHENLRAVAAVAVQLQQAEALGSFAAGCPVCRDRDTQESWDDAPQWGQREELPAMQQQQGQGQETPTGPQGEEQQLAGGAQEEQQEESAGGAQPEADQSAAGSGDGGKLRLSVGAAEYVPHKLRASHVESVQAFQVSITCLGVVASLSPCRPSRAAEQDAVLLTMRSYTVEAG
jgi:hypothetical protein